MIAYVLLVVFAIDVSLRHLTRGRLTILATALAMTACAGTLPCEQAVVATSGAALEACTAKMRQIAEEPDDEKRIEMVTEVSLVCDPLAAYHRQLLDGGAEVLCR